MAMYRLNINKKQIFNKIKDVNYLFLSTQAVYLQDESVEND